jgi:hypothetical protein
VLLGLVQFRASGLTEEGIGILEEMLQDYLEGEVTGSSDPTGMLTDAAEEMLEDLAGDIESNRGFTLWVQLEYSSCDKTSGWNPWGCCYAVTTHTFEHKCTRSDTEAYEHLFGGRGYPDPTSGDIQRCLRKAREELREQQTVP